MSEDKRLIRLGIDPDGDPREIQNALDRKIKEIEEKKLKRAAEAADAPVIIENGSPDNASS